MVIKFTLDCAPPDLYKIPREELICKYFFDVGTTALIVSMSYMEQEFIRVGFYIHNEFKGERDEG